MMNFVGADRLLTLEGLRHASNLIGCDAASVLAVVDVEASGCGFTRGRRPKILFERHIFHRLTEGAFDEAAPDLSSPSRGQYGQSGDPQYERLDRAAALNEVAALEATSWGMAQIMGFNAGTAGFPGGAAEMAAAFVADENEQLMAMARFIKANRLDGHLRKQRWGLFANGYNGSGYWQHDYDGRLSAAYDRRCAAPPIDMDLRARQMNLMFAGLYNGRIDGVLGPRTLAAIEAAGQIGVSL